MHKLFSVEFLQLGCDIGPKSNIETSVCCHTNSVEENPSTGPAAPPNTSGVKFVKKR